MKKFFAIICSIFFLIFIDYILSRYFSIKGIHPNIWLAYIVFVSLFISHKDAVITSFFCGMVYDILNLEIFGLYTLIFTTIGYLCGWLNKRVDETLLKVRITVIFLSSVLYLLLLLIFSKIFSIPIVISWKFSIIPFIDTFFGVFFIHVFVTLYKKYKII